MVVRLVRVSGLAALLGVVATLAAAGLQPASAASIRAAQVTPTQSNVSSNWAGYVATGTDPTTGGPTTFSSVTGTWVQPKADCSSTAADGATSSAFWVGLGGDANQSNALEQTGTEADCTQSGVSYFAWYELVPAGSVKVRMAVSAGDKISASVGVVGSRVTIHLQNLTRGTSFTKTLPMAAPDTTSAEWIAEAPSVCGNSGYGCSQQTLTNFGTVSFTDASAESGSHTGSISDSAWSETPVVLESGAGGFRGFGGFGQFSSERTVFEALPSTLTAGGSAFTVTWRKLSDSEPGGGYGGGFYGGGSGGYGFGSGGTGGGSPGGGLGI